MIRGCLKIFLGGLILGIILTFFVPGRGESHAKEPRNTGPTALVRVVPIKMGPISKRLVAFGRVVASPGRAKVLSIPYESLIGAFFVLQGQEVAKGTRLLEVGPTPGTLLKFEMARNNYRTARLLLIKAKRQARLRLITNRELIQAEQAFRNAGLVLNRLRDIGASQRATICSKFHGIVSRIFVSPGSIVPAGSPVMEIVAQDAVEIVLGVEPEDAHLIRPGDQVSLTAVNRPSQREIKGRVQAISRSIDPSSRSLDVFVSVPSPPTFMLNEYVRGDILVASKKGLLVPRSAVLPEGSHSVLYTLKDGKAIRHIVSPGLENDRETEISGPDVSEGDLAIVLGNYELRDGMAVRVEKAQ